MIEFENKMLDIIAFIIPQTTPVKYRKSLQ